MAVRVKVDPIDRDVKLIIDEDLSPEGQAKQLADFAIAARDDTKALDETILGIPNIPVKTWVDGVEGASESAVNPGGTIVYEFPLISEVLLFISDALEKDSPIGGAEDHHPGMYRRSHRLFADGVEVGLADVIPDAIEYLFVSSLPYARKIEDGESGQAPAGVYEVAANEARKSFGNIGVIEFIDYMGIFAGTSQTAHTSRHTHAYNKSSNRFPAIRVTVK